MQNNSKSTLLHALRTYRGGVALPKSTQNQQPKWHTSPTTPGRVFFIIMLYKLWTHRGVNTPRLCFYIVNPAGIVTVRECANSQTCRKWGNVWNLGKLHHTLIVKISQLCISLYVYYRVIVRNVEFVLLQIFHLFKDCTCTALQYMYTPACDSKKYLKYGTATIT